MFNSSPLGVLNSEDASDVHKATTTVCCRKKDQPWFNPEHYFDPQVQSIMNTATVQKWMPLSGRAPCSAPLRNLRFWQILNLSQRSTCSASGRRRPADLPTGEVSFTTPSSTTSCIAARLENTQTSRCFRTKCCCL